MKVYVAEKPSVGRAIAARLAAHVSPSVRKGRSCVEGADWAVCWLSGHVLEAAEPDVYIAQLYPDARKRADGRYIWSYDTLPVLPPRWQVEPVEDKRDLLDTASRLVRRASVVVHAGDADREGQRLVDEVLEFAQCTVPVRRILPTAIDEATIARVLADERDNKSFKGMSDAALARGIADWLWGMNISRVATLRARQCSPEDPGTVPTGRIMSPLLGLIVRREREIEAFVPVEFSVLTGMIEVPKGKFRARLRVPKDHPGVDAQGRLVDTAVAARIRDTVTGQTGKITQYSDAERKTFPPLPFAIADLQIVASRKFGLEHDETLKIVQALYEGPRSAVTYPRSEVRYLPEAQHALAPEVVRAVQANWSGHELSDAAGGVDTTIHGAAFNDAKTRAHHGIVPTGARVNVGELSVNERRIYEEICRRYLAQFMPPYRYREVNVEAQIAGYAFTAAGRTPLYVGWKALYGGVIEEDAPSADEDAEDGGVLPPMRLGEPARCERATQAARRTSPPERFTRDTLLGAMLSIEDYVTDPKAKAQFEAMKRAAAKHDGGEEKEQGDGIGIGTSATRHTFTPKLINAGLIATKSASSASGSGKARARKVFFVPTAAGCAVEAALPAELTRPDLTGIWELVFSRIEAGTVSVADFIRLQERWITQTINEVRGRNMVLPPKKDESGSKKGSAGGRKGHVAAKKSRGDGVGGKSVAAPGEGAECSSCTKGVMRLRRAATGATFLGCSNYPACRHTEAAT